MGGAVTVYFKPFWCVCCDDLNGALLREIVCLVDINNLRVYPYGYSRDPLKELLQGLSFNLLYSVLDFYLYDGNLLLWL